MSNSNLTWLDWALLALGLLMLVHMPLLISMDRDAAMYDSIRDTMGE
jgi:hypothetical protein